MPLILGKSQCGICREILISEDDLIIFPAFISNQIDPLWKFNDSGFHKACFLADPLVQEAGKVYEAWKRKSASKICIVCNQKITDPDDYLGFGYLTSDTSELLYEYNHLHFHRSHLSRWKDLKQAYAVFTEYQQSGKWNGVGLSRLLEALEKATEM